MQPQLGDGSEVMSSVSRDDTSPHVTVVSFTNWWEWNVGGDTGVGLAGTGGHRNEMDDSLGADFGDRSAIGRVIVPTSNIIGGLSSGRGRLHVPKNGNTSSILWNHWVKYTSNDSHWNRSGGAVFCRPEGQ